MAGRVWHCVLPDKGAQFTLPAFSTDTRKLCLTDKSLHHPRQEEITKQLREVRERLYPEDPFPVPLDLMHRIENRPSRFESLEDLSLRRNRAACAQNPALANVTALPSRNCTVTTLNASCQVYIWLEWSAIALETFCLQSIPRISVTSSNVMPCFSRS